MVTVTDRRAEGVGGRALPLIVAFLAGAVILAAGERYWVEAKYSTFVKSCPNLTLGNHIALRTPEGRIMLVSLMEIPDAYLSTFCPDPKTGRDVP